MSFEKDIMDEFSLIVKNTTIAQFPIRVTPNMTILDVKHVIQRIIGISPEDQKLLIFGRILPNRLTISKLKLKDKNSIFLSSSKLSDMKREKFQEQLKEVHEIPSTYCFDYFTENMKENDIKLPNCFKDIESLREGFMIMKNPNLRKEFLRMTDNIINKMEFVPAYHHKMISLSGTLDEYSNEISNFLFQKKTIKTNIPKEPLKAPSTEPIHLTLFSTIFDIFDNNIFFEHIFKRMHMSFNIDECSDDDSSEEQYSHDESSNSFKPYFDFDLFSSDNNEDDFDFKEEISSNDNNSQISYFFRDYSDDEEHTDLSDDFSEYGKENDQ